MNRKTLYGFINPFADVVSLNSVGSSDTNQASVDNDGNSLERNENTKNDKYEIPADLSTHMSSSVFNYSKKSNRLNEETSSPVSPYKPAATLTLENNNYNDNNQHFDDNIPNLISHNSYATNSQNSIPMTIGSVSSQYVTSSQRIPIQTSYSISVGSPPNIFSPEIPSSSFEDYSNRVSQESLDVNHIGNSNKRSPSISIRNSSSRISPSGSSTFNTTDIKQALPLLVPISSFHSEDELTENEQYHHKKTAKGSSISSLSKTVDHKEFKVSEYEKKSNDSSPDVLEKCDDFIVVNSDSMSNSYLQLNENNPKVNLSKVPKRVFKQVQLQPLESLDSDVDNIDSPLPYSECSDEKYTEPTSKVESESGFSSLIEEVKKFNNEAEILKVSFHSNDIYVKDGHSEQDLIKDDNLDEVSNLQKENDSHISQSNALCGLVNEDSFGDIEPIDSQLVEFQSSRILDEDANLMENNETLNEEEKKEIKVAKSDIQQTSSFEKVKDISYVYKSSKDTEFQKLKHKAAVLLDEELSLSDVTNMLQNATILSVGSKEELNSSNLTSNILENPTTIDSVLELKCPVCDILFLTLRHLNIHLDKEHDFNSQPNIENNANQRNSISINRSANSTIRDSQSNNTVFIPKRTTSVRNVIVTKPIDKEESNSTFFSWFKKAPPSHFDYNNDDISNSSRNSISSFITDKVSKLIGSSSDLPLSSSEKMELIVPVNIAASNSNYYTSSNLLKGSNKLSNSEKGIDIAHWDKDTSVNKACALKSCGKIMDVNTGRINCRTCGKQFCKNHLDNRYSRVDKYGKHDPENGKYWCKVCPTCYDTRNGKEQTIGKTFNRLLLFKSYREQHLEDLKVHSNSIKAKLAHIFLVYIDKIKYLISMSYYTPFVVSIYQRKLDKSVVPWVSNSDYQQCQRCNNTFTFAIRRHHCRLCGDLVCFKCLNSLIIDENIGNIIKDNKNLPKDIKKDIIQLYNMDLSISVCSPCLSVISYISHYEKNKRKKRVLILDNQRKANKTNVEILISQYIDSKNRSNTLLTSFKDIMADIAEGSSYAHEIADVYETEINKATIIRQKLLDEFLRIEQIFKLAKKQQQDYKKLISNTENESLKKVFAKLITIYGNISHNAIDFIQSNKIALEMVPDVEERKKISKNKSDQIDAFRQQQALLLGFREEALSRRQFEDVKAIEMSLKEINQTLVDLGVDSV